MYELIRFGLTAILTITRNDHNVERDRKPKTKKIRLYNVSNHPTESYTASKNVTNSTTTANRNEHNTTYC